MKIPLFALAALACFPTASLHAALEWDKKEIALVAQRGAQTEVRAVFDFRNPGKNAVTILGVTTSCGCTEATPETSVVPAGGKSRLWAIFTVGDRHGHQEKTITVETDDPASPRVVLVLKIDIREPDLPGKRRSD